VAAFVMLESIAFISIVTAAITSSFVERARRDRMLKAEGAGPATTPSVVALLQAITARLDRIERALEERPSRDVPPS